MYVKVMMDSGLSISLIMKILAKNHLNQAASVGLKLVSAAGDPIPVIEEIVAPISVKIQMLLLSFSHTESYSMTRQM